MDFKTLWVMFSIMCWISFGLNSKPIAKYQRQYLNYVKTIQNIPQQRIDNIFKIVDSEDENYYKLELTRHL